MNKPYTPRSLMVFALALTVGWLTAGCESDDGDSVSLSNIGENDASVVVCMGDSITAGGGEGGAPYPGRLGLMSGKNVINEGRGGERSTQGAARIGAALNAHKPGVVMILYGANDLLHNSSNDAIIAALRSMIHAARANQTVPILATLTPMTGSYQLWAGAVLALNDQIRALASSESVKLVDLEKEFSDAPTIFLYDGLHPNDMGNHLIASAFAKAL